MKQVIVFCFLLCSFISGAQNTSNLSETNSDDNTLLWEISGNGLAKPSYIFGTFHLLCKQDINFSNACRRAISNSHEVYFELDLDDPATLFGGFMLLNMKDGKQLDSLLTADEYKRVSQFFKDSLKASLGIFKNMKPYFLIAMLYPKMLPCESISGVEEGIMAIAKEDKKEIKGLETMAFQASVFDSIPYKMQAKELLNTIDSMDKSRKYFALMNKAYLQQDMSAIEKLVFDTEMGMKDNEDILLNKRNKDWVNKLKNIMKNNPVFIAVGTGHLIGNDGIIQLLKNEGYQLRPLKNK